MTATGSKAQWCVVVGAPLVVVGYYWIRRFQKTAGKRDLKLNGVSLVGAPLAEGQDLNGVELGPASVRKAGLQVMVEDLGLRFFDRGDVIINKEAYETEGIQQKVVEQVSKDPPLFLGKSGTDLKAADVVDRQIPLEEALNCEGYYPASMVKNSVAIGEACKHIYDRVASVASEEHFVLTIGGDHSIACGTIAGIQKHRPETAVIWVDAHGDCNTPDTSPSGNYHGMPCAHVLGWFKKRVRGFEWMAKHLQEHGPLPEERLALIGLRDLDAEEKVLLKNSKVKCFTMHDIDRHGIGYVMDKALKSVDPHGKLNLHLSFDVDGCDPMVAPGTGTLARGGISYREAHFICERMAETGRLTSMDLVEINPMLDTEDSSPGPPSEDTRTRKPSMKHSLSSQRMHGDDPRIDHESVTVRLGVEIVCSALGRTTL